MTDSTPKSRLPRTGTLVLIAVVLLIGGGALMVWLPYHQEQQAIVEIEKLGGRAESEIVRPFWIPDAVDDEYLWLFTRVDIVFLSYTKVSDAGLEHLRGLTNLKILVLHSTQISDAGLEHIRGLTSLEYVWLNHTQVGDAGLEHLRVLNNLKTLWLQNTQVTQAGIKKLQKALPDCEIDWTTPSE